MCGVVGANFIPEINFDIILKLLSKRGPDFQDFIKIDGNILGHTRLSIIDLDSEANQPMIFDDIVLVFNGEIYNYKELIDSENLKMKTKSDTEVIIRLYQKYGEDFLNKLNGMFSFCLFDKEANKFFCARDRYGKKPFFYYFKDGRFIFSSMIKPIIEILGETPKIDKVALSQYLQYFVPLGENTFFQNIKKLESSSYFILKDGEFTKKKYYKVNTYKRVKDEKTALESIERVLVESVERRIKADVKIGTLLSGGIDSSLISAIYTKISGKKVDTFSVGYSDYVNYSELPYAKITADFIDSNHHTLEICEKDFIENLENTLDFLEEPHADSAAIPLYLLTKEINKGGIKAVLSGEGSDELFLGYDNYAKFLRYYEFKRTLSSNQKEFLNSIILTLQNNTKESEYLRRVIKNENLYNSFGEIFTNIQKRRLFKKIPHFDVIEPKNDPVDNMSYIDLKIWLGDALLSKVDKMSMANSVEVRNPFLDFNLVNLVFSIDSKIKVGDTNKYLLKKIAQKYIPMEIINRSKKGFNSPYNEWIFNHYGEKYILDLILEVNNKTDFFNIEYIKKIFFLAKDRKFKQHLWSLFVFSKWFKRIYM